MGCRIPVASNLNIDFLKQNCTRPTDFIVIDFLQFGCPIGLDRKSVLSKTSVRNYKGATEFPKAMNEYIQRELSAGACIGPFDTNPFSVEYHLSPLNSVEKRDSEERRVILDLSFPPWATSVNSAVDLELVADEVVSLKYPTIDALVELVVANGRGSALFKCDLRRAYRQLPVDPGDIHVLGYRWDGKLYFDTALPMGLKSSAFFCQKTTNLIRHMFEDKQFKAVNYLDDFGASEKWNRVNEAQAALKRLLKDSGLDESVEKEVSPTCIMVFLGILFNTILFTISIDEGRLHEIRQLIDQWLVRVRCTRRDLQSLLGKLRFVASCVRPGRIFTNRLLAFLRQMPISGSASVPDETKQDLRWWKRFMGVYNGVSMMPEEPWSAPDEVFSTDACLEGCGGWFSGAFFHARFPQSISSKFLHVNALELLTVMVALKIWAKCLTGKRVTILCDNMASVMILNRGITRDKFQANVLREITFLAATGQFQIRAVHLAGSENRIADLLSRWDRVNNAMERLLDLSNGSALKEEAVLETFFTVTSDW